MGVAKVWNPVSSSWEEILVSEAMIPKSIGDAKGDLIGFSGADTPVKIAAASADGSVLTSDTAQTGGVKWLGPLYCVVYDDSGGTSITSSETVVPMPDELHDPYGLHDPVTNNGRINLSRAGMWLCGFTHTFLNSSGYSTGQVYSRISKNGVTNMSLDLFPVQGGGFTWQPVLSNTALVYSDGDDFVQSQAAYTAGSTSTVGVAGRVDLLSFWAIYLGAV